jgi:hypothetical protein
MQWFGSVPTVQLWALQRCSEVVVLIVYAVQWCGGCTDGAVVCGHGETVQWCEDCVVGVVVWGQC